MTRKKVVLYLDDNPAYLQLMRFIINCHPDIRILVSSNVDEALRQLERTLPDLIFINVHMEEQGCHRFARQLRSNERSRSVPLIGMGKNPISDEQRRQIGLTAYLPNKLDVEAILMMLDKYPARELMMEY